jgi:hypothetical protein
VQRRKNMKGKKYIKKLRKTLTSSIDVVFANSER